MPNRPPPPDYAPPKPDAVTGSCTVDAPRGTMQYHVDLDTMTCSCERGEPWYWFENNRTAKWLPQRLCSHKLKAVASLADKTQDPTVRDFYEQQLGKNYNAFEAVSAFHKELRRGDVDLALYWATVMIPHRGVHGVIAYMRNILFEETRDVALAKYILKVSSYGKSATVLDMQRGVRRFCEAPKKWHLPWRVEIFIDEMRGYKRLAEEFGYDVAKPKDIIPAKHTKKLTTAMIRGFRDGDRVLVQYGLKGWFKSVSNNHEHMKVDIFNVLVRIMNDDLPSAFEYDHDYAMALYRINMMRLNNHNAIGYHELNVFADALTGEPGADPRASLTPHRSKAILSTPKAYRLPYGVMRKIPSYAQDNHTWEGKRRMKSYMHQLQQGADQTDLDFRICGAYMGVAWRTMAIAQHGTIDCKWGDVKFKPNWLWTHLDQMWY